jgi:hypothetical protein
MPLNTGMTAAYRIPQWRLTVSILTIGPPGVRHLDSLIPVSLTAMEDLAIEGAQLIVVCRIYEHPIGIERQGRPAKGGQGRELCFQTPPQGSQGKCTIPRACEASARPISSAASNHYVNGDERQTRFKSRARSSQAKHISPTRRMIPARFRGYATHVRIAPGKIREFVTHTSRSTEGAPGTKSHCSATTRSLPGPFSIATSLTRWRGGLLIVSTPRQAPRPAPWRVESVSPGCNVGFRSRGPKTTACLGETDWSKPGVKTQFCRFCCKPCKL